LSTHLHDISFKGFVGKGWWWCLPDLLSGLFCRLAGALGDGVFDLVCDACARSAGAEHHEARLVPLCVADLECRHDGCQSHTACPLDIVVEASNLRGVLVKNPSCVVEAKVFEVDVGFGVVLPRGFDEGVDEIVVLFACGTGFAQTEVEVVVKQLLVLHCVSHTSRLSAGFGELTSVPQSSTTGRVLDGWIPAHSV
jgi:hypothetical protein